MAKRRLNNLIKVSASGLLLAAFLCTNVLSLQASAAPLQQEPGGQRNEMSQPGQPQMQQGPIQQGAMQQAPGNQMGQPGGQPGNQQPGGQPNMQSDNQQPGGQGELDGQLPNGEMGDLNNQFSDLDLASSPSEIVTGTTTNSAMSLSADENNATTFVMSDSESSVKIDSAGTYIVTGNCSDGNITVKKNTTGVILILRDLTLTSTTGATVSCNKGSEAKIIIEGSVNLTDAENPSDEDSSDSEVADAFDGAALKVKDGANAYLTGSGTLTINASSCKNGIKVGNDNTPSLVIDVANLNITAANDAINSGYDLAILDGSVNISAGDDGIHADRILTIGDSGNGPAINISSSYEGLEGTVVNLFGGTTYITASDDGVNAANSDGTYASLGYSINITGGTHTINCSGDGLDSNGNINITGGYTTIHSGSNGGEAGIDYDGTCYIADGTIENFSGISRPDNMMGQNGQNGQQDSQNNQPQMNGQQEPQYNQPQMNGQQEPQYNQPQMNGQQGPQNNQPQMNGQQGPQNNQPQMNGQQGPQNNQPQMNGQQEPQNNQPQMREMGNSRPIQLNFMR